MCFWSDAQKKRSADINIDGRIGNGGRKHRLSYRPSHFISVWWHIIHAYNQAAMAQRSVSLFLKNKLCSLKLLLFSWTYSVSYCNLNPTHELGSSVVPKDTFFSDGEVQAMDGCCLLPLYFILPAPSPPHPPPLCSSPHRLATMATPFWPALADKRSL